MPELPISFKEFAKSPLAAMLYLCIAAIVGLFTYLQISSNNEREILSKQINDCQTKNFTQDVEMKQLRSEYIKSISLMNRLEAKIETLKELGKIQ